MRDATNASYYHLDKAYVNIISLPLWGGIGLYNHNIRSRDFRDSHATHPFLSFFHLPFPLPPFYPNPSEQTVLPLPVRSLQRAIVPMDDVESDSKENRNRPFIRAFRSTRSLISLSRTPFRSFPSPLPFDRANRVIAKMDGRFR